MQKSASDPIWYLQKLIPAVVQYQFWANKVELSNKVEQVDKLMLVICIMKSVMLRSHSVCREEFLSKVEDGKTNLCLLLPAAYISLKASS
jgi:ABC-type uncharacterized transport system permease subunit